MQFEAAINTFANVDTRKELWDVFVARMKETGVSMIAYHATDTDGQLEELSHDGFPKAWVERYMDDNLYAGDPFPELAANMERPIYWHELSDLIDIMPEHETFLQAMEETGVGDGIAFYLYGPGFQNAFTGLGFGEDNITLSKQRMFELQCLAQAAHLRYCMLSKNRAPNAGLTKREIEVLEWIAAGKSNSVIADILDMSPHTVDSHVRRIFTKLNVSDRTTATLRGLGLGLIRMSDLAHT